MSRHQTPGDVSRLPVVDLFGSFCFQRGCDFHGGCRSLSPPLGIELRTVEGHSTSRNDFSRALFSNALPVAWERL